MARDLYPYGDPDETFPPQHPVAEEWDDDEDREPTDEEIRQQEDWADDFEGEDWECDDLIEELWNDSGYSVN